MCAAPEAEEGDLRSAHYSFVPSGEGSRWLGWEGIFVSILGMVLTLWLLVVHTITIIPVYLEPRKWRGFSDLSFKHNNLRQKNDRRPKFVSGENIITCNISREGHTFLIRISRILYRMSYS